jgi:hypothetical protein
MWNQLILKNVIKKVDLTLKIVKDYKHVDLQQSCRIFSIFVTATNDFRVAQQLSGLLALMNKRTSPTPRHIHHLQWVQLTKRWLLLHMAGRLLFEMWGECWHNRQEGGCRGPPHQAHGPSPLAYSILPTVEGFHADMHARSPLPRAVEVHSCHPHHNWRCQ